MVHNQVAVDVTEPLALEGAARTVNSSVEVAVDVEADSMHHFRARLCFVQLATVEQIYLLDTLAPGVTPKALGAFWENEGITKYFHAAGGDLQFLSEEGVRVRGLFDTHRAATLLGWPKVGLADLVKEQLGQTLKKEHQQADFSVRPLPAELREYIADDVRYLVEVGRRVLEACRAADIEEAVRLDCQRLCDEAAERPDPAIAGVPKVAKGSLTPSQRPLAEALARALHAKRLQWAEQADVPMGRMLSNMAIGALAVAPPDTAKALAKVQGVRGAFVREHGEEVLALIADLKAQAAAGTLPTLKESAPVDRDVRRREEALLAWRKEQATKRKVTPSVVLSNALVSSLSKLNPQSLEALGQVPYLGRRRLERDGAALLSTLRRA